MNDALLQDETLVPLRPCFLSFRSSIKRVAESVFFITCISVPLRHVMEGGFDHFMIFAAEKDNPHIILGATFVWK